MRIFLVLPIFILFTLFKVFGQSQNDLPKDTIDFNIDLQDVVISSQYLPTHYKNSIFEIKSILKDQIEKSSANSLDQILNQQSNIRISYDPVLGAKITLRGMGAENVAILQDGVPIIGRLDGAIDLSQIDINNIERIEIIEGPQSVIYGNNASAGIINIVSKKSQLEKLNLQLIANLDEPRVENIALSIGANIKKFYFNGGASYLKDEPYQTDSLRIFEEFTFDDGSKISRKKYPWNPKLRLNTYAGTRYFMNEENSFTFNWDFSNQAVNNFGELRRPIFMPYAFDENYLTNRNNYKVAYNGKIKNIKIDGVFARNKFLRILENQRFEFDSQSVNPEQTTRDSFQLVSYLMKLNSVYQFEKGIFTFGTQYLNDKGLGKRIADINASNSSSVSIQELAVFSDLRYNISSKLTSSLATRITSHSNYGIQVSPSFQNLWKVNNRWTIRSGYSRGFRSPDLKELYINFIDVNHFVIGNNNLEPELTNDWNLSFSYEQNIKAKNIKGTIKFYRSKIQNKIVLAEFEPLKFQYKNLENFSVYGSSLDLAFQYENWKISNDLSVAYWYNLSSEFSDSPRHSPVIDNFTSLVYEPKSLDFSINLSNRFVGRVPRYFVSNETIKQSITAPYQISDLNINYFLFNNSLNLQAGVRNILNVTYSNVSQNDPGANHSSETISSSQLVGRGRSFYLGFRYKLSSSKKFIK